MRACYEWKILERGLFRLVIEERKKFLNLDTSIFTERVLLQFDIYRAIFMRKNACNPFTFRKKRKKKEKEDVCIIFSLSLSFE